MANYSTPGVYVKEISTFPPSVAPVSTAIPAFIGYTETGSGVHRIDSMLEYSTLFGEAKLSKFTAAVAGGGLTLTRDTTSPALDFSLYYSVDLYYKNGGGSCYIVSIGNYADGALEKVSFSNGLAELEKEDEPTLIVMPDAVRLSEADYASLVQEALAQAQSLGDRFGIFDVKDGDVDKFREIGSDYLAYGSAYHPYLATSLNYQFSEDEVMVSIEGAADVTLASIKTSQTTIYNQVKAQLGLERVVLPPSGAIAGVYARVDRDRGVWKAPANVSLASVIGPVEKITHNDQERLNVDPTAGKSINAIRSFAGKGTLVWGARTLAGNDNEWRYVSVRRLFNMIEESTKKATSFAVFEPNDATTWLKVKAMIESFLYGLWEQGALAGPTPEAAYFVNVGLGKTMTAQDVLEGVMNVEIGIAAVRPAEFIILKFSHKLQEA